MDLSDDIPERSTERSGFRSDGTDELLNLLQRFGVSDGCFDESTLTDIVHSGWTPLWELDAG